MVAQQCRFTIKKLPNIKHIGARLTIFSTSLYKSPETKDRYVETQKERD